MKYAGIRIIQLTYVLVAVMLWPYLSTYVNNPDTFQYINIANEYAAFQFPDALNGYWSPMISWLLVFFPIKGLQAIVSFKILQLMLGFAALSIWYRIVERISADGYSKRMIQWMALPFLLDYAYLYLTADLVFFTVLLLFLDHFITQPVWNNRRRSLQAGLLVCLLYFSKSFGLPFGLSMLLLSLLHHRITGTQLKTSFVLQSFSICIIGAGIWVGLISYKYGHFTISEAAALNTTREIAPLPGQSILLPVVYSEGLLAPASPSALSAWEEPLQSAHLTRTHPFASNADALHRLEVIKRNLMSIWYFDFSRQVGVLFLLSLSLLLLTARKKIVGSDPLVFYPLGMIVLLYSGYSLVLFHARYSWICTWLMVLLIAAWCKAAGHTSNKSVRFFFRGLLCFTVLLAIKRPVKEILYSEDGQRTAAELVTALFSPFRTLEMTYDRDKQTYEFAKKLSSLDGTFASRYSKDLDRPAYFRSLLIAQSCGKQYYGQLDDNRLSALTEMQNNNVRYFLTWELDSGTTTFSNAQPIHDFKSLKVFNADSSAIR